MATPAANLDDKGLISSLLSPVHPIAPLPGLTNGLTFAQLPDLGLWLLGFRAGE